MNKTQNLELETQNSNLAGLGETVLEAWRQIWARRAARLAEKAAQEDAGERIELVLVELGREVYGLDVHHVFDIKPAAQITRVPRVAEWVAGVVNLRGRVYSVIDLRRFLGLERAEGNNGVDGPAHPYLAVVETAEMEVALLVDDVLTVESLSAKQMQDAADTIRGINAEYVRGVAEYASGDASSADDVPMLVVLDLLALLADKRLIIHEEIV